jgi:hypothetical protein
MVGAEARGTWQKLKIGEITEPSWITAYDNEEEEEEKNLSIP